MSAREPVCFLPLLRQGSVVARVEVLLERVRPSSPESADGALEVGRFGQLERGELGA